VAAPTESADAGSAVAVPDARISGVLERLVQARADAWNGGDPDRLAECFADGSAALEHDREVLDAALAEGHRYEGVAFVAKEIDVLSETEDRLSLEVTLTTGRYAVRTAAGSQPREATTARVRLALVRMGGEDAVAVSDDTGESAGDAWRIERVAAAGA
jgi:hypothetical protein